MIFVNSTNISTNIAVYQCGPTLALAFNQAFPSTWVLSMSSSQNQYHQVTPPVISTGSMRHGKNMWISVLDVRYPANCNCSRYKVILCSNSASGSTFLFNKTTKSWHFQQASLYLCFLCSTPRIYVSSAESHFCRSLWNLYREIKVGWPLAGPGFISSCVTVQSRHLQIRPRSQSSKHMFQIFHTHTRYTSNSLPGGEFYPYQRYSLRCFNDFFSSNSHW